MKKINELPCPTCGQDLQLPADINAVKLAALREAGEKMAGRLRVLRLYADKSEASADALEAWEAANK